jgi:mannose-6-phosphate isomerase class I
VGGKGKIDGAGMEKGDSYFIPASYGEYTLTGEMEIILTYV